MLPAEDRVESLVGKVISYVNLRIKPLEEKRISIILYGFPPNAGAIGTAAYLDVFQSLQNTLLRLGEEGYKVEIPQNVQELKEKIQEYEKLLSKLALSNNCQHLLKILELYSINV